MTNELIENDEGKTVLNHNRLRIFFTEVEYKYGDDTASNYCKTIEISIGSFINPINTENLEDPFRASIKTWRNSADPSSDDYDGEDLSLIEDI